MDKMREEFEGWCDEQGCASDKYSADDCGDVYKHLVGEYLISETRLMWKAWKASRAALCVELPKPEVGDGSMIWNVDVEVALDKAGVSYK